MEHHTVAANGIDIAYHDVGSGPVVLLLHGFPDTARTWDGVSSALVDAGYRTIAPYLRGYAPTSLPDSDTTMRVLGEDALALLDALKIERAVFVGHDWGASAVYAAAALAPERVERLVAVAIPHLLAVKPTPSLAWGARHFLTLRLPGAAKRFARNDHAGLDKLVTRWAPSWERGPDAFADAKRSFRQPGALDAALGYYRALTLRTPDLFKRKLGMPSLLVGGLQDIVPASAFEASRRGFVGDLEICMLDCGHFPHREQPEAFNARLLSFLGPAS